MHYRMLNKAVNSKQQINDIAIAFINTVRELSKKEVIDRPIYFYIKYGYILVYISFLFYGQGTSSFISSRFLHASTFPLIVVYSYYMQHHKINKNDRAAIFLLGLYAFYKLAYPMYKWW